MADHPLRPATDRSLGRPLPHQQANQTRAPRKAARKPLPLREYAVLAAVSSGCSPLRDRFPRVTHPCATDPERSVRLACVKHAASVRSEPGSNSQVDHTRTAYPDQTAGLLKGSPFITTIHREDQLRTSQRVHANDERLDNDLPPQSPNAAHASLPSTNNVKEQNPNRRRKPSRPGPAGNAYLCLPTRIVNEIPLRQPS